MQSGELGSDSFMAIYNHDSATDEDNERYLRTLFNRLGEQAWDEKGNKIDGVKVLTPKETKKFAMQVLANWKRLTPEENESYIEQNYEEIYSKQEFDRKVGMNFA